MIDTELRLKANRAIDGNATLQGVRLELGKDRARLSHAMSYIRLKMALDRPSGIE